MDSNGDNRGERYGLIFNVRSPKFKCPECGYHIYARKDDRIICLRSGGCKWSVIAKRKDDMNIPSVADLRKDEGEA